MDSIQTRIELPDNLYRILKDEQQKRRDASGKKISLNDLVLEYFIAGLQTKLSGLENVEDKSFQHMPILPAVISIKEKSLELTQREQLIVQKERNLLQQAEDIKYERIEFREQEQSIREQMQDLYEMKDEIAEEKEKIRQMRLENVEQNFNLKIMATDMKKKDEEIQHLKEEVMYHKDTVIKALERIDDKTDSNFLQEWVIPLLPTVISIIGYYSLNSKINSLPDTKPIIGEVDKMLSGVGPEKKDKMMKQIKTYIQNNRSVITNPKAIKSGERIT